jgi:hypothetical protein
LLLFSLATNKLWRNYSIIYWNNSWSNSSFLWEFQYINNYRSRSNKI